MDSRAHPPSPRRQRPPRTSMASISDVLRGGCHRVERLLADAEELQHALHGRRGSAPRTPAPPGSARAAPPSRSHPGAESCFHPSPPNAQLDTCPALPALNWGGSGLTRVHALLHENAPHPPRLDVPPPRPDATPNYLKGTALSQHTAVPPDTRQLSTSYLRQRMDYLRSLDAAALLEWRIDVLRMVRTRADARQAVIDSNAMRQRPTPAELDEKRVKILLTKQQQLTDTHVRRAEEHERMHAKRSRAELRRVRGADDEVRGRAFMMFAVHALFVGKTLPLILEKGRVAQALRRERYVGTKYGYLWRRNARVQRETRERRMGYLTKHLLRVAHERRLQKKNNAADLAVMFLRNVADTTMVFRAGHLLRGKVSMIALWWRRVLVCRAHTTRMLAKQFVVWHVQHGCISDRGRRKRAQAVMESPLYDALGAFEVGGYLSAVRQVRMGVNAASQQGLLMQMCAVRARDGAPVVEVRRTSTSERLPGAANPDLVDRMRILGENEMRCMYVRLCAVKWTEQKRMHMDVW